MAAREEILSQYAKLPAFRGLVRDDIDLYISLALEAVSGYAPKQVKMKGIPGCETGRYDVPLSAETLLAAYVKDTSMQIELREEETLTGERSYLLLGVRVPSYIDLVDRHAMVGYEDFSSVVPRRFRQNGGLGSHDLEFTVPLKIEDLSSRQLIALRYYAESEAYQFQATKVESLSDITDRESNGASTTLRRSQSGNTFQKLSERRQKEFRMEIARPYWSRDTWGITEVLWSEGGL